MSWSHSFGTVTPEQDLWRRPIIRTSEQAAADTEEVWRSIYQAQEAAAHILSSGVVGDPAKHSFTVSASGHSNPGNVPAEGWANDCITVSVVQA